MVVLDIVSRTFDYEASVKQEVIRETRDCLGTEVSVQPQPPRLI